jgi:hypothetical protein
MASWFMPGHVLLDETYTLDAAQSASLTFASIEGFSPITFGTITLVATDSDELSFRCQVYGTTLHLKKSVRVRLRGGDLALGIGGLSLCQSLRLHRVQAVITVRVPRQTAQLAIFSGLLAVRIQSAYMPRGQLSVHAAKSSTVIVGHVSAQALSLQSVAGAVMFSKDGEIQASTVQVMTKSGHLCADGAIFATSIHLRSTDSGALHAHLTTDASQITMQTRAGHLDASIAFAGSAGQVSTSKFASRSGAISVSLKAWSGLILAESKSGAVHVHGKDVHKSKPGVGWRLGVEVCLLDIFCALLILGRQSNLLFIFWFHHSDCIRTIDRRSWITALTVIRDTSALSLW